MVSIDIVIPVYNEEKEISKSIEKTVAWINNHQNHDWRIVIADNASQIKH